MKTIYSLAFITMLCTSFNSLAQNVGIGTNTPDASAKLHVVDANRGILIPNVAIGNVTAAAPVTAPATGLLVYNTNATVIGGNGTGFYYWSGTQWLNLITASGGDIDFYEVGSTAAPNAIGDDMYTNGRVAIGNNTPGAHTLVVANAAPAIKLGSSAGFNNAESGRLVFDENVPNYTAALGTYCGFELNHDGAANLLTINSACTASGLIASFTRGTRYMGIKTNAPTADLSVNGVANKTGGGTWAVFSDARLKENVSDYNEGLDLILQVRPVNFSYNAKMNELIGENQRMNGKVFQGVIAQELQEIAPDMVNEIDMNPVEDNADLDPDYTPNASEKYLEVDPNKFTYALINAVQEQQEMIELHSKEMTAVEAENEALKSELKDLKKRMERLEELIEQ
ncbi:MAG: tail fiber domain-containing protein [Fluviicola sp.]